MDDAQEKFGDALNAAIDAAQDDGLSTAGILGGLKLAQCAMEFACCQQWHRQASVAPSSLPADGEQG